MARNFPSRHFILWGLTDSFSCLWGKETGRGEGWWQILSQEDKLYNSLLFRVDSLNALRTTLWHENDPWLPFISLHFLKKKKKEEKKAQGSSWYSTDSSTFFFPSIFFLYYNQFCLVFTLFNFELIDTEQGSDLNHMLLIYINSDYTEYINKSIPRRLRSKATYY